MTSSEPQMRFSASRVCLVLLLVAVHTLAYQYFNQGQGGHSPRLLPLTSLDRAIPLLPWTVWPYLALIVIAPIGVFWIRSRSVFRRTLVAYGLALSCLLAFYAFVPTTYPRPEPSFDVQTISTYAWSTLTSWDTPRCAFPSGHIVAPWIVGFGFVADGRGRLLLLLIAVASLSLLTTKQHYTWDVAGGVLLVGIAWRVAPLLCRAPAQEAAV